MADEKDYSNQRTIGKVKEQDGQFGKFKTLIIDTNRDKDGSPNQYHKGNLIWADAVTGKNYLVKQVKVKRPKNGMPDSMAKHGFSEFLEIELDSEFHVQAIE